MLFFANNFQELPLPHKTKAIILQFFFLLEIMILYKLAPKNLHTKVHRTYTKNVEGSIKAPFLNKNQTNQQNLIKTFFFNRQILIKTSSLHLSFCKYSPTTPSCQYQRSNLQNLFFMKSMTLSNHFFNTDFNSPLRIKVCKLRLYTAQMDPTQRC